MHIVHTIAELRDKLSGFKCPAFVPTMGNLHDGHIALVKEAKPLGDVTVSSIFVNRLQFAPHEDFDSYPRTLDADAQRLEAAGCNVLFAPREKELYPEPQTYKLTPPSAIADLLEGEFRPGFFTGVCTVVLKLFNCVQPAVALFGQKDYQQLMVISQMTAQLALPIRVIGSPTVRAADGLALSSRNAYLSATERAEAVALPLALQAIANALRSGATDLAAIELAQADALRARGWQPDYLTVRRRSDLLVPTRDDLAGRAPLLVLAAAKLGATRLIDNLEFDW